MEELFRFSLTRPADRTNATTLPLERETIFQREKLIGAVPSPHAPQTRGAAAAAQDPWAALQGVALDFVKTNLQWIVDLTSQAPPSPIPALQKLLADLQGVQPDSQPTTWLSSIQTAAANTKANAEQLNDWGAKLADLFLALMIVRSVGPTAIDKLIRNTFKLLPPPVPLPLQPAFAQILHDRPSLDDIANLLRMIDLVTNAVSILGPPPTLSTADDVKAALTKTLLLPPNIFSRFEKPAHAVGFTDLLVVRQHIARYELGEIARIENILKGESRAHSQKHTLSNERDVVLDTSTQTETDQELTTTDHISLQNEIENTLKEDTKVDAGVHVQYNGGSVNAQADLTVGYDRSSSESKKFASNIAKDITQKAAKKVTQKVQQTITTKVIETFEETEGQSFDNKSGPGNISGVYQWVEKVYLAQVFSYGKHMLFDIMVPEPAASLLLEAQTPPPDQRIPVRPDPLAYVVTDITGQEHRTPLTPSMLIHGDVANFWVGKFQVTGVEPEPTDQIFVADGVVADGRDQSQNDVKVTKTIQIADGYQAKTVNLAVAWYSDDDRVKQGEAQIDIQIGGQTFHFSKNSNPPPTNQPPAEWGRHNYSTSVSNLPLNSEEKSIAITIKSVYTDQVSVNFEIVCKAGNELKAKWQLQAYEKIVAAWQKLQADYEEKMSAMQFQKGTMGPLGTADPETNRQIERTELKRSCIAILSDSSTLVDGFDALVPITLPATSTPTPVTTPTGPPPGWVPPPPPAPGHPAPAPTPPTPTQPGFFDPDLAKAETFGSWVRWFEQAFEWDKIGYVFYPYYWGRSSEWIRRLNLKNDDPLFLNFLQAGYGRVVVPVRNGFEDAVNFYLLTGRPWLGGGLPKIWDKGQNPLYLSITEEIKELTGGPIAYETEKLHGDPWEIRLPAALIKLRGDDKLPMWKWNLPSAPQPPGTYPPPPPNLWTWSEDTTAEQNE